MAKSPIILFSNKYGSYNCHSNKCSNIICVAEKGNLLMDT
jgi:hypothetical protein